MNGHGIKFRIQIRIIGDFIVLVVFTCGQMWYGSHVLHEHGKQAHSFHKHNDRQTCNVILQTANRHDHSHR